MPVIVPKNTFKTHGYQLNRADYYSNFSLLFRKYVPWRDSDYKFPPDKWVNFEHFRFDDTILSNLNIRGQGILSSLNKLGIPTLQFVMRTTWRLITGMGASSALEVGMILHHIYGVPYIPGSSLKGLLRYYLHKVAEWDVSGINNLFGMSDGDNAAKGKIVFLDAFPEPGFQISVDIMNNHYQEYYMGDKPPADWMDPNPVKFLTVKNATFTFRLFANTGDIEEATLKEIAEKLAEALTESGIGAKTAVGYGRLDKYQQLGISQIIPGKETQETNQDSPISVSFNFYDEPDGTKEYYLKRLDMIEPFSDKVQWLFQKWERDEQWKVDKEIAQAFLPKIKKEKKSGKETHFYKVLKQILERN